MDLEQFQLLTRVACIALHVRYTKILFMIVWNVFCVMERVEEHEDHGYEYNESSSLAYASHQS